LGDGSFEVAGVEKPLAGIGGELSGLQVGGGGRDGGSGFSLFGRSRGVSLEAEDGGQRSVGSGEIGLEAEGFAQGSGGLGKFALLFQDCA